MRDFKIKRPGTVEEALELLGQEPGRAAVYAGGTELIIAIKQGLLEPATLIDIKGIPSLAGIRFAEEANAIDFGARVTHVEALSSQLVRDRIPFLAEILKHVGNVRVRTAGTLVGNLCFAEPRSDVAVISVLLEGQLKVAGEPSRWVAVEDFLVDDYTTVLREGELVEMLRVPVPDAHSAFGYARLKATERPLVAVGVRLDIQAGHVAAARIVAGAVAAIPYRSREAESVFEGVPIAELGAVLPDAAHRLATGIDAMHDYDASAEYRRHLAGEMLLRAAGQALEPARGASN
ncbi:MAG: FAD binding domain-containing protein [Candidatus Acidiferrales bacterium]